MKINYDLDDKTRLGLSKLRSWLEKSKDNDLTGTVAKSIELISYIQIRDYYTEAEKDLLNEIRNGYIKELKSK
jgi:hypothetical protein